MGVCGGWLSLGVDLKWDSLQKDCAKIKLKIKQNKKCVSTGSWRISDAATTWNILEN